MSEEYLGTNHKLVYLKLRKIIEPTQREIKMCTVTQERYSIILRTVKHVTATSVSAAGQLQFLLDTPSPWYFNKINNFPKKKSKCWQDTLRVPAPQNFPDIRFSFAMPSILIVQDLVKQNYQPFQRKIRKSKFWTFLKNVSHPLFFFKLLLDNK